MTVENHARPRKWPLGALRHLLIFLVLLAVAAAGVYAVGFRLQRPADPEGIEIRRSQNVEAEKSVLAQGEVKPRNIILFVADGMGFGHLSAARAAHHGIDGHTAWDRFTTHGWLRAHPSHGYLTDSAASATALSSGVSTYNGAVGVDAEGSAQPTLFERAAAMGYRTGAVTDSYFWDATPAAFMAHAQSRGEGRLLIEGLSTAPLDVLFGELKRPGERGIPSRAETEELLGRRYAVLGSESSTFEESARATAPHQPVAALFAPGQLTDQESRPNLETLTAVALHRLHETSDPFVLLVESEETDSASHRHDFPRLLRGFESIEATLEVVLDFAERTGDTLVIFTSDHETGGLALGASEDNSHLEAIWSSDGHTGSAVPLMAMGPGARYFGGSHANWRVGQWLALLLEPGLSHGPFSEDVVESEVAP